LAVLRRRTLTTARSRARLPDRAPTRRGDAAVKGIRILGTNRSTIRPADDVAVWARASPAVTEDRPMTTDKAFKRVVRARMAKTGERYAAARRALLAGGTDGLHAEPTAPAAAPSGYRMRGGLHPETATLANALANQGVVSGVTGEPLTEAAILGIGGGLGAGYILWQFKRHGAPVLTLGFRNQWQYPAAWTAK